MKKTQKPGYLVLGAILICIVSVLIIYFLMISLGLVRVSPARLLIVTESAEKLYDGEPLTAEGWEIADGELLSGHVIEARVLGTQTEVGDCDNTVAVIIRDSEGADVTSTYEIEYQLGKLSVKGKRLEFRTMGAEKYYDGTPLSCPDWEFVGGELMPNHEYTAYTIGQITNIGKAPNALSVSVVNVMTGQDVTSYYSIECTDGELVVSPRRLVISMGVSGSFDESGGDISKDGVVVSGNLLEGHRAIYEPIETSMGNVSVEAVLVKVLDAAGNDVTEFYEVIYASGDLSIENANTYLPQSVKDLLNTNEYKEKFEQELGSSIKNTEGGIDVNGDGVPDLTVDENGMVDINGDGKGDIPAAIGALAAIECFKIESDRTGYVYLREKSYGDYDGNDWKSPVLFSGVSPYHYANASLREAGHSEVATLKVTPLFNNLKYVLSYYHDAGLEDRITMNDCFVNETAEANVQYTVTYLPYEFSYTDGYTVPEMLKESEAMYFEYVLQNYLNVPESTKDALLQIATEEGLDPTDISVIEKVAEYIRNAAEYNLDFADFPDGVDNIIYFLTEGKEGVCRHFAAAATLMYRSLGIPARYVTGFASPVIAGEETTVRALQAHAWVEVYISGFGWAQIEVTPSSGIGGVGEGFEGGIGGGGGAGGGGGGGGTGGPSGATVSGSNPMGGGHDSSFDNKVMFQISSPNTGAVYMRSKSFGDFDGKSWLESETRIGGMNPFTFTIDALERGGLGKTRTIMIKMLVDQYPYMLPYYTPAQYIEANAADDCMIDGTWYASDSFESMSYTYYDYVSSHTLRVSSALTRDELAYRMLVHEIYTNVDEATAEGLRAYANEHGIVGDESNIIERIASCIKSSAKYSLKAPEVPDGENAVLYFLNVSKEGKCSHFATAATLMYRAFGIPARYTVGYLVDIKNTAMVDVTGRNAHAWIEVYVDGAGWVRVEATPSSQEQQQEKKTDITFATTSYSKYYDGTGIVGSDNTSIVWTGSNGFAAQSANKGWVRSFEDGRYVWTYEGGEPDDERYGHHFYEDEIHVTGSKDENVGSRTNTCSVKIYDANEAVVTSRYNVKYTGTLTVKPIEVYITTDGGTFEFDEENGIWFEDDAYTVTKIVGNGGKLLDDHEVELDFDYGKDTPLMYPVESAENKAQGRIMFNGVDVAEKYYQIIITPGIIKVN